MLTSQLLLVPPTSSPPPPRLSPSASATVAHPDLAAQAPQPRWVPEGGEGATGSSDDPHETNRKVRRAARATIAGGVVAIVGGVAGIGGLLMFSYSRKELKKLEQDNGGHLPPDDPKRQHAIVLARVGPAVGYAGLGVFVVGAIVAAVAGRRFKALREQRRTSVAMSPLLLRRGAGLGAEVRF